MVTSAYRAKKASARLRSSAMVLAGQDIGALPPIVDPARRQRAQGSYQFFCETYFPNLFNLAWSADHLRCIAKIEAVVTGKSGTGLLAMAMPRGSGKTTMMQVAVVWATLAGFQQFVFLINATADYSGGAIANIKQHLSTNDLLLADWPEMIYPIRCLENESRRCSGQRYYGKLTHIGWANDEIVFPTIPGSTASAAIIKSAGLLGNIRGAMHIRPDGMSVRPTLGLVDDPQTDESAKSPSQCASRLSVLNGAILNLAGPGKRIAVFCPCTVIRPGDVADQLLDREKNPEWQGERTKMVYTFPAAEDTLWKQYLEIRAESLKQDGDGSAATRFYAANRAAMDAGAVVGWEARFDKERGELSAIQHAMNLKARNERAFWAEYQNQPLPEETDELSKLTADEVSRKLSGYRRRQIPPQATHLTAFVDVQGEALFWVVCAWEDNFTGYVIDYGTYPDQQEAYFTVRDIKRKMKELHPGGLEAAILGGLDALIDKQLAKREFRRESAGGGVMKIEQFLVDANWGKSTDTVYQFCQTSAHAAICRPYHGKFVGASSLPFSEYHKKPGDRVGMHWRIPVPNNRRAIRHVASDVNYWKTFIHERLGAPAGAAGCLSLFTGGDHRMFADHVVSEYPVATTARGRTVDEWRLRQGVSENHWFDGVVGSAVAASIVGCVFMGMQGNAPARARKKYTTSTLSRRNAL